MVDISANIRLRPVRIGFLVRPTDLASIKEIMRYCVAVWGGVYNPIIPVFRVPPKAWTNQPFDRVRGLGVAKGYVRFFEPDVYVEAENGLLERAGLGAIRERHPIYPDVLALADLLKPEKHRDFAEPAFGLSITDVQAHLYREDQQFTKRDRRENIIVKSETGSGLAELIFGVFPSQTHVGYIAKGYDDVFQPTKLDANLVAWQKVFKENAVTPLRVTGYGLDNQRHWYHDALIYVFDPRHPADLIDGWNLRLEPHPVVPVPVDWFEAVGDHIFELLKSEHRRIQGSPQNLMHNATIEFGRSISQPRAESLLKTLKSGLPPGALAVKYWRNRIWVDHRDSHYVHREHRMIVTASERSAKLVINENGGLRTTFDTLSPDFARRYGGRGHRWVNALTVSAHLSPVATVLPFNTEDSRWPRLGMGGERVPVGSEGWIFMHHFKDMAQSVKFLSHEAAIAGTLSRQGISATLSEPGHIAKQMLEHLGGLWDTHLLADRGTLTLLNKMAGGVRTRSTESQTIEESFELRAAPLKDWIDLIAKRKQTHRLPEVKLEDFTSKNVIRLGLETDCPHCQAKNWTGLGTVDYEITCDRCLKAYPFPQAHLKDRNRNWFYRVVGPFSVPDYGRGSYAALLALRLLNTFTSSLDEMTFATAMKLSFGGGRAEIDFLALKQSERSDLTAPPDLILGEAKSAGKGQAVKPGDLSQLKAVASKLPGAVIVIAVLRDHFLPAEKRILQPFVKWGRRLNADREPTNPVLLLTSNELMFDYLLSATWKDLGGVHAKFGTDDHTRNVRSLADATQQIYLGLPSFDAVRRVQWEKRMKSRRATRVDAQSICGHPT
jgi:hypothetical protein